MSKELSLDLDEGIVLYTVPNVSEMYIDGDVVPLGRDTLGKISEWLAVAWENIVGEEYKPVVITERGYVAQDGVVRAGEVVIPKSLIGNSVEAIKKRAAVLPLFADKMDSVHDDGNGLERDCE